MSNRVRGAAIHKTAARVWIKHFAMASYDIGLSSAEADIVSISLSRMRELRDKARAIESRLDRSRPLGIEGFKGDE